MLKCDLIAHGVRPIYLIRRWLRPGYGRGKLTSALSAGYSPQKVSENLNGTRMVHRDTAAESATPT